MNRLLFSLNSIDQRAYEFKLKTKMARQKAILTNKFVRNREKHEAIFAKLVQAKLCNHEWEAFPYGYFTMIRCTRCEFHFQVTIK
jgi:hypothetical protein